MLINIKKIITKEKWKVINDKTLKSNDEENS